MENDLAGLVLVIIICALSGIGLGCLIGDYRHFDGIVKQCKEQGYIQNNTTRILCSIEEKK